MIYDNGKKWVRPGETDVSYGPDLNQTFGSFHLYLLFFFTGPLGQVFLIRQSEHWNAPLKCLIRGDGEINEVDRY